MALIDDGHPWLTVFSWARWRRGRVSALVVCSVACCALLALSTYACSSEQESEPATTTPGAGGSAGSGGAGDGGLNIGAQDGLGGGVFGPCSDHAGQTYCNGHVWTECSDSGQVVSEENCQVGGTCSPSTCVDGQGCVLCQDGQYWCDGPYLKRCNTSASPVEWEVVETCAAGQACDVQNAACTSIQIVGGTQPTGVYFQYAHFVYEAGVSTGPYRGGMDVGGYGDYLYVHREASGGLYGADPTAPLGVDVYQVELLDSDGDGELEPNQHPDDPDNPGPIEERVLTYIETYEVSLGIMHCAEIYALSDRLFSIPCSGIVNEYVFNTGVTTAVVSPTQPAQASHLGFDDINQMWIVGHENRQVQLFHEGSGQWVPIFQYPDMAGSHGDGLEVVTDPKTGTPYVYVSDMTSDFLAQYRCDPAAGWVQENLFDYVGTAADYVEGMGFGPLRHFWVSTVEMDQGIGDWRNVLKEIGGSDLAEYVEEPEPTPR
ncbi:MAG: hypothetical protein JRI23_22425 [Deltaproteobacteria bacterium]|jgi:hypothetical protein|nr:hypothetical protein [Deltaproteobacteria bacterium]MBW2534703.1 hypothetical protein [Deltaproteobacteria bacterium]